MFSLWSFCYISVMHQKKQKEKKYIYIFSFWWDTLGPLGVVPQDIGGQPLGLHGVPIEINVHF